MADIKFRAWDKLTKTMRYVLCIDWLNGLVDLNGGIIERKYNNSEDDEVILMQYTGLKDKNGKDIYEGDIVEAWSEGQKAIGKVKQRIDGLWLMYPAWQSGKSWGLMPNKERKTTVEIIGNIYENKELIDEVQDDQRRV